LKEDRSSILNHWRNRGSISAIDARLAARGISTDRPTVEALASEDQLHVGQMESLRLFADWVGLAPGSKVLDLGSGLGGPARWLAADRGAHVTAVELSPKLHNTARELTNRLGLGQRVRHVCADILDLEVSESFDLVWLQHTDMHVPEKVGMYEVAARALAEGGRVVWHDWLAGPGGAPRWPLPWSDDGSGSCLVTEARFGEALGEAGLRLLRFEDIASRAEGWLQGSRAAIERALTKSRSRGDSASKRLANLLSETDNALAGIRRRSLVQFFAEATPHRASHP